MSTELRDEVAGVVKAARMTPYEDGKGGWLFRESSPNEITDALLPLIREREAAAWDAGMHWGQLHWTTNYGINGRVADNPFRAALDAGRGDR